MTLPKGPYVTVAAFLVASLLSFLGGRASRHPRVETVEKVRVDEKVVFKDRIVEAKASSDDTSKVQAVRTVTVVKTRWLPGGVVEKEATTTAAKDTSSTEAKRENTHRTIDSEAQKATLTELTKTVIVDARPDWSVAVLPGVDLTGRSSLPYHGAIGGAVDYRLVGNAHVGAWGMYPLAGGAIVRLEF